MGVRLFLVSFLAVFIMLLVPGTAVQELAAWLQFLNRSVHVQGGLLQHVDKLVHLGFFAVLAFTGWRAFGTRARPWLLLGLFSFAVLTEWLQGFVPGRSTSLLDLVANSIGIGVGASLGMLVWREGSRVR